MIPYSFLNILSVIFPLPFLPLLQVFKYTEIPEWLGASDHQCTAEKSQTRMVDEAKEALSQGWQELKLAQPLWKSVWRGLKKN